MAAQNPAAAAAQNPAAAADDHPRAPAPVTGKAYQVPEDAKQAVAAANTVGDIPKGIRMKLYNAVGRALKAPNFPQHVIAKWAAAADDPTGKVRLELLQAFIHDPTCATMVLNESQVQETTNWDDTSYVFKTQDDLERDWKHLPPPKLEDKVKLLVATARSRRPDPCTGEMMYEVRGRIEHGTRGCDRQRRELQGQTNIDSGAAAQELLQGYMGQSHAPRSASLPAIEDGKPQADGKKQKKVAAAKKQPGAAAADKRKAFVHPAAKRCEALRKKLAVATTLRGDIEMAVSGTPDVHTQSVLSMLATIVKKGDAMVARLTDEVRNARCAVNDETWPALSAEAEQVLDEAEREVKFAKARLLGLKPKKAKTA